MREQGVIGSDGEKAKAAGVEVSIRRSISAAGSAMAGFLVSVAVLGVVFLWLAKDGGRSGEEPRPRELGHPDTEEVQPPLAGPNERTAPPRPADAPTFNARTVPNPNWNARLLASCNDGMDSSRNVRGIGVPTLPMRPGMPREG